MSMNRLSISRQSQTVSALVARQFQVEQGWGDVRTWTAIDADTKADRVVHARDAALHAADKWIQQEAREPRPHGRAVLYAL
jgi:hypothetical protein